ncbi:NAD-dependent deacylase [Myxococcus llanfairpwllgwyngyllgogerychwyrndrobwllllantysiliogogogochensis]|uniref:protein acetyllysine N-acetyltransferase n=1 Tax=Myxococcus llanfairpwllgwyngyllgogerychwyrndrobwllllantysiliogogogochensis TaxID=2590453 RepID=A0A540WM95_9BACT|nr:NAD-dependent deacylase [Myxococcus llanfairpwllgwyngyllgogerychwyrndrobwllllantysiliogogogochensis]TQF10138.1 NAD-dependent deacylase [Myxococcus llanfairpwllgwyngyllgogerychwyrndrobwllllantysiliogogogochensis]
MTALLTEETVLRQLRHRLQSSTWRHIVVLTGAGISVASGLPTYRGPGGLWTRPGMEEVPDVELLARDPSRVWKLFGSLRGLVGDAQPNAAHLALAEWAGRLGKGSTFTLLTQNVDGLHTRAGSPEVVELHGSLLRTCCSNPACTQSPFADTSQPDAAPACPACGHFLRPDITLFGEPLPVDAEWAAKKALRDCDLFIAIGTSGTVAPAANFVRGAKYAGAWTLLVNLTPMEPRHPDFDVEVLGPAEQVLPVLLSTASTLA